MMTRLIGFGTPLLLVVVVACGGKSFDTGGESAGNATGGTDNGGTEAGGTSNGGTSNGGTSSKGGTHSGGSHTGGTSTGGTSVAGSGGSFAGSAGAGGASSCDEYGNETGSQVQVLIVNDTMNPIYLGATQTGCNNEPLFKVQDAQNQTLVSPGFCNQTCQNVMDGSTPLCPPIACAINSVTELKPGESLTTQWSGAYMAEAVLPPECDPAGKGVSCERVAGVKPGTFTFLSQAGSTLDCSQNGGGMCQACMTSPNGGCTTYGAIVSGMTIKAETKVLLDGSYGVGGPGGGGMVRSVEIDFK